MEKGYYFIMQDIEIVIPIKSQSTIKMEKGYYKILRHERHCENAVAIHNKNGKGLLHIDNRKAVEGFTGRNPQ